MNELTEMFTGYRLKTIGKDDFLILIKSCYIDKNPSRADYNHICKEFRMLKILFVSTNDLEFLTFFNKMIKIHNNMKQALLGENTDQYNCKANYFEPDEMHFGFSQLETYSEKFHYLIHTVHDIRDLSAIFTKSGIRLQGHSNKDYHGVSLIWFGTSNENDTSSRYGSISFKIKIDKVLAKGSNYFAMGTRIFKKERSHSILITNREHIRMQSHSKMSPNSLEFDFPRTVNIQENELLKKVNSEWFLNDGLQLNENLRVNNVYQDWDHPEFCLEANEENGGDHYAYCDFDDFEIFFLEHDYCVKKSKSKKCMLTRRKAMREFLELIEVGKLPPLSELRNFFDKETLHQLL